MSFPVLRNATLRGACLAAGCARIYYYLNGKPFLWVDEQSKPLPIDFQPTQELFSAAIEQNQMCRAGQILQRFQSEKEKMWALKGRGDQLATPLDDSAEALNVKLAELYLNILCNAECADKLKCQKREIEGCWPYSPFSPDYLTCRVKDKQLSCIIKNKEQTIRELLKIKNEMEVPSSDAALEK